MLNTYIYDGSFEGLLTAIFDSWTDCDLSNIRTEKENIHVSLIENNITTNTDIEKANRISKWINNKIGTDSLRRIYRVYLTEREDRAILIYRYLKLASKVGKEIENNLTHPDFININNAERLFSRETMRLQGFVRFEVLDNNILYAQINPEFNQLEIIAPFFSDRYLGNPWIIHDTKRNIAAIFDGQTFILTDANSILPYSATNTEKNYREMWKNYLVSLTINERLNLSLQQKFVPLKARKYMTEFK